MGPNPWIDANVRCPASFPAVFIHVTQFREVRRKHLPRFDDCFLVGLPTQWPLDVVFSQCSPKQARPHELLGRFGNG